MSHLYHLGDVFGDVLVLRLAQDARGESMWHQRIRRGAHFLRQHALDQGCNRLLR